MNSCYSWFLFFRALEAWRNRTPHPEEMPEFYRRGGNIDNPFSIDYNSKVFRRFARRFRAGSRHVRRHCRKFYQAGRDTIIDRKAKKPMFRRKLNLSTFFPFLEWFEKYTPRHLKRDAFAGLAVALVLIPQSMAYAQLAGLPSYYGLYAAFLPPAVASLFGSSRQLATGPVAVASITFPRRFWRPSS